MLMVISPAKTLDFDSPQPALPSTLPQFRAEASELVAGLRALPPARIAALMQISPDLAALNHARFQAFGTRPPARLTRQAVLAFRGDVYLGMRAETFDADELAFAQEHLRILSGLYGVLRPLDRIQPYRLEMGTSLATARGRSLYAFWGDRIAKALRRQLAAAGGGELVNLASQEYFQAVDVDALRAPVVTPVFKEWRGGQLRLISFSAKRARGMMAGFAVRQRITRSEELKDFAEDGYAFQPALSSGGEWLFTRGAP